MHFDNCEEKNALTLNVLTVIFLTKRPINYNSWKIWISLGEITMSTPGNFKLANYRSYSRPLFLAYFISIQKGEISMPHLGHLKLVANYNKYIFSCHSNHLT